jgi:hypothetical protein
MKEKLTIEQAHTVMRTRGRFAKVFMTVRARGINGELLLEESEPIRVAAREVCDVYPFADWCAKNRKSGPCKGCAAILKLRAALAMTRDEYSA